MTVPGTATAVCAVTRRERRALAPSEMWGMAGSAVVATATQVPLLAGSSQASGMRRGQALLDALASFGLPLPGEHRRSL